MADKQYTLTDEQFKTLLGELKAGQGKMAPPGVSPYTPDEQVGMFVDQLRKGENREAHKLEDITCQSQITGAKFTAVVCTSKAYPAGRVLSLKDYEYPVGSDVHVTEGGLVPEGLAIKNKAGEGTKEWKQWRWINHYQQDLKTYVGRDAAWLRKMADTASTTEPTASVAALGQ